MWQAGLALGLWALLTGQAWPQAPMSSAAGSPGLSVRVLDRGAAAADVGLVVGGSLDDRFTAHGEGGVRVGEGPQWLELILPAQAAAGAAPAVSVSLPRDARCELFYLRDGSAAALPLAATLPAFRGRQEAVWVLPAQGAPVRALYARVSMPPQAGSERIAFSAATLEAVLARDARHARMISIAFGALTSLALATLLIWFVLADRLFVLYSLLFFLQALYLVFLSGQGFQWPLLAWAQPLGSYAWNVPVGLSGAVGCLFVREIADLEHFSPRIFAVFGWLAWMFVAITVANLGKLLGLGMLVHAVGNLLFLGAAIFTLAVAFVAWRAGNRAAGWFLAAWGLLEGFTIAAAIRCLSTASDDGSAELYYFWLPLAMMAAAVLIALGVADRVRQQRLRLTEAERRAQTDPLTGVLNRRSLLERLEAVGAQARARGLPVALLFLDLDHFKQINDTHGHAAGDACLRAIVGPIQSELRQSDVVGRYGGEEFVVILSGANSGAAGLIAGRMLARVADVRVEGFGAPIRLTCSIGIASSDTLGVWGEHLLARADAAVYAAKRSGRNQVQIAPPLAA